jgi:hypothetical protein
LIAQAQDGRSRAAIFIDEEAVPRIPRHTEEIVHLLGNMPLVDPPLVSRENSAPEYCSLPPHT